MSDKCKHLDIRMSDEEVAKLKKLAAAEGISVSAYIRMRIVNTETAPGSSLSSNDVAKYNRRFWFRLTEREHKKVQKIAAQSNCTVTDVIRNLIRTGKVPYPRTTEIREEVRQLIRIGNNLNQIAAVANTHKKIEDERALSESIDNLNEVLDLIMSRLKNE